MRSAVLATMLAVSLTAFSQGTDVGLVNLVSGDATYTSPSGPSFKVQAFMKVREGDRFTLPAGAQMRVVYFDSSRQEHWVGPGSFSAAKGAGTQIAGKPAEVTTLPAGVEKRIAQMPTLMQYARFGGIQVRGGITPKQKASLEQQETMRVARETYEGMRKTAQADDITPELFMYSALYEFLMYPEMKTVVAEMMRKQPGSEEVKVLDAWVTAKLPK